MADRITKAVVWGLVVILASHSLGFVQLPSLYLWTCFVSGVVFAVINLAFLLLGAVAQSSDW
jgi:uncharacterized membrane protein YhdT